jgi:hypothetical protein
VDVLEVRTIVTEEELIRTRTEHAEGTARLAALRQLLLTRLISLRDRDALEAGCG